MANDITVGYGIEGAKFWRVLSDTKEGVTHDTTGRSFAGRTMNFAYTPTSINVNASADNKTSIDFYVKNGGNTSGQFIDLDSADEAYIYGSSDYDGINISTNDDVSPILTMAFITKRSNKKINLRKIFKLTLSKGEEKAETVTKSGITLTHFPTTGVYMPLQYNGRDIAKRNNLDIVADAAFIAAWFDDPMFTGENSPDTDLSALSLGALTLSPTFDPDTTAYTATTSSATNTITAAASDSSASIVITLNGNSVANGASLTWNSGSNSVKIIVIKGEYQKAYTITVTKSS